MEVVTEELINKLNEAISKFDKDDLEQITEFKEAFSMITKYGDSDVTITNQQFATVMKAVIGSEDQVQDIIIDNLIDEFSANNYGFIDLADFVTMISQLMKITEDEEAVNQAIFRAFDKDGNGFLSFTELRGLMTTVLNENVSSEAVKDLTKDADTNGDGLISYEEFVQFVKDWKSTD